MTEKQQFADEYGKLSEKYGLPDLDDMDYHFQLLDTIGEKGYVPSYPLRFTRRNMVNVFYGWINYLHNFIMPNRQSAILMEEADAFSEEQKKEIIALIKEIMFINRLSTKLDLELSEEKDAEFIRTYYQEWPNIKEKLQEFAAINLKSWRKDIPNETKHYFG